MLPGTHLFVSELCALSRITGSTCDISDPGPVLPCAVSVADPKKLLRAAGGVVLMPEAPAAGSTHGHGHAHTRNKPPLRVKQLAMLKCMGTHVI